MSDFDEAVRSLNHAVKLLREATEKPIPPKLNVLKVLDNLWWKSENDSPEKIALRTAVERLEDAQMVAGSRWDKLHINRCGCEVCEAARRILRDLGEGE